MTPKSKQNPSNWSPETILKTSTKKDIQKSPKLLPERSLNGPPPVKNCTHRLEASHSSPEGFTYGNVAQDIQTSLNFAPNVPQQITKIDTKSTLAGRQKDHLGEHPEAAPKQLVPCSLPPQPLSFIIKARPPTSHFGLQGPAPNSSFLIDKTQGRPQVGYKVGFKVSPRSGSEPSPA